MFRPRTDAKIDALHAHPALAGLSRDDVAALARLADIAELPPGSALATAGTPGQEVFLLLAGEVAVERDGTEIAVLGPGEFVGEMALLDRRPRGAAVRALTPVRALVFNRASFQRMLATNQPLTGLLLSQITGRLRAAQG